MENPYIWFATFWAERKRRKKCIFIFKNVVVLILLLIVCTGQMNANTPHPFSDAQKYKRCRATKQMHPRWKTICGAREHKQLRCKITFNRVARYSSCLIRWAFYFHLVLDRICVQSFFFQWKITQRQNQNTADVIEIVYRELSILFREHPNSHHGTTHSESLWWQTYSLARISVVRVRKR